MQWQVYLSGEIHTDWREQIIEGCKAADSIFTLLQPSPTTMPVMRQAHLGGEEKPFWRDNRSAKVNAIRIQILTESCDIAVIRFGDKYKQWNAGLMQDIALRWANPISPCTMRILFTR